MSAIRWQVRRALVTGQEQVLGTLTAPDQAAALRAAWRHWHAVPRGEVVVQSMVDLAEEAREEVAARRKRADGLPVQP